MSATMAERGDATDRASDLSWERSYDRASVERFLAGAQERCAQLRAELAAARERGSRAQAALERREVDRSAELVGMVAEAHRRLAALEAEHQAAVEAVRTAAREEADRIRADATGASARPDGGHAT